MGLQDQGILLLAITVVFYLLVLTHAVAGAESTSSTATRSLLRDRTLGDSDGGGRDHQQQRDAAIDLNSSNFDSVLSQSLSSFALVEFFAHWCPACRNYKPHYERVARLFNGPDAVHPGIISMARVDCAEKMNTNLCDRFSVGHFPMLLWGPPSKFVSSGWDPKKENNEIRLIDDGRTAERLLNWINKQIGGSFNLDDERYENEDKLPSNTSYSDKVDRAIYDVEEATAKAFDIILEHKMIKLATRVPLIKFFQLLTAHHPSKRCRRGIAEVLINFDDLWPRDHIVFSSKGTVASRHGDYFKDLRICQKEVPRGYWMFCRGSRNESRGFSCGLWILFHSLTVQVEDGESNLAFTAICDFVHNFFICEECRRHFYDMCLKVSVPLNTTRDISLWLWRAHNKVNERLMKVEKDLGTGDPKFPKTIWPSQQLCPDCYSSTNGKSRSSSQPDWNEDEVFKFLVKYYGKMLVSSYIDEGIVTLRVDEQRAEDMTTSTNAVSVPIGAALAIALASCAFGALACFWRVQQKNRKQRKSRS